MARGFILVRGFCRGEETYGQGSVCGGETLTLWRTKGRELPEKALDY